MFFKSKKSSEGFQCGICGEIHGAVEGRKKNSGIVMDMAEPAYSRFVPSAARPQRMRIRADCCETVLGQEDIRSAVHAQLKIPIQGRKTPLIWGVWVDVPQEDFTRYRNGADADMSDVEVHGDIWVDLPAYSHGIHSLDDIDVVPCLINFGGVRKQPKVQVLESAHLLYQHQQNGVSWETACELIEDHLHPNS